MENDPCQSRHRQRQGEVDQALKEALARYEEEKALSEQIRSLLLPKTPPSPDGYELAWQYWGVSGRVTGDFYDAVLVTNKKGIPYLHFIIGDVSGHGLAAADRSVSARHMWRAYVRRFLSPKLLLSELNRALLTYGTEEDGFATALCGSIHLKLGTLSYARAGHPPPIICRASGACELLRGSGPPLGLFDDIEFESPQAVSLDRGDLLILHTDGISELYREGGYRDLEGLVEWVQACPEKDPCKIITYLRQQVDAWCGSQIRDDIALVVIRREASSP